MGAIDTRFTREASEDGEGEGFVSGVLEGGHGLSLTSAAKLRSWRVSIIRKRGQYLDTVEARNEKTAEATAVAEFDLSDEQRRRLLLAEAAVADFSRQVEL